MGAGTWTCWHQGLRVGDAASRRAAMNLIERPYRHGNGMVMNRRTGEKWERRAGSWNPVQKCWPTKERSA